MQPRRTCCSRCRRARKRPGPEVGARNVASSAHRAFSAAWPGRPPGITFRPIHADDRDFLSALYASTREEELRPVPWPDEAKRAFLASQFELQHTHYHRAYPDADFLLILDAGEPVGRVYIHRALHELSLIEISLIEARRCRGLGSALLGEILDEARATGHAVTLHVEPDNPAKHLYARLGFTLVENQGVYDFLRWSPPVS